MANAPLPNTNVPVLGRDGQFTLPWRRWFQALSGVSGAIGPEGPAGPAGPTGPEGPEGAGDIALTSLGLAGLDGSNQTIVGGAITFGIADGSTGTSVTLPAVATRSTSVTLCLVQIVAADGAIDLTFDIKRNGSTIFGSAPTITHGSSPGQQNVSSHLAASPTGVLPDDVFTLDITSGSSSWKVTIALG